jgi:hypothetical protein
LQRVDRGELKLDQQVKVEPNDFVRKGMYSPLRDKHPDVLPTLASQISKARDPVPFSLAKFKDATRHVTSRG